MNISIVTYANIIINLKLRDFKCLNYEQMYKY